MLPASVKEQEGRKECAMLLFSLSNIHPAFIIDHAHGLSAIIAVGWPRINVRLASVPLAYQNVPVVNLECES